MSWARAVPPPPPPPPSPTAGTEVLFGHLQAAKGAIGKPAGDGDSEAIREEAKYLKKPGVWVKVASKNDLRKMGKPKLETRKSERPKPKGPSKPGATRGYDQRT